jgi:hypothetical protein
MKKLNAMNLLPLMFLSLLSINCAHRRPPDVPVFKHLRQRLALDPVTQHVILKPSPTCMKEIGEPECGRGKFIMSGKVIFVGEAPKTHFNKKPWSQLKRESILVPAVESYAPISTYIINACKELKCDDEVTRFQIQLGDAIPEQDDEHDVVLP